MAKKRCDTCIHRNLKDYDEFFHEEKPIVKRCYAVLELWTATSYRNDSMVLDEKTNSVAAFVEDGSNYKAELYTRPHHYCSMHYSKDAEKRDG